MSASFPLRQANFTSKSHQSSLPPLVWPIPRLLLDFLDPRMKHLKPWQAPIFQLFPLLLICLALSWLPPTLSEIYQRFKDCAPINYTCGNLTVPVAYPFRIDGRHDYCGYKEYFLICSNNHTLTINIGDRLYQVKDIDYMNQMLKIADPSSINGTCPLPLGSTTLDLTLYEYSERDLNLTFFFNCTPLASNSVLHDVGCNSSIIGHRSYYMIDGHGDPLDLPRMCRSTMIVSVDQAAISMLESNTSSFGDVLLGGFSAKWIAGNGWCSNCSLSGGLCGHNADSPSDHTCICSYGLEIGTCSSGSNSSRKKIAIGVSTGLVGFLFISLMLFIYLHNRKKYQHSTIFPKRKANNAQSIEAFLEKYGSLAPRRYTYSDVRKMTKSFAVKLGQGGFGTVFKGNLISGHPVAVKVLIESKGDGEEFVNEVASIGKTSHVNIVSLLGFCLEGTKRALIYDFMPNGSLDKYIYTDKSKVEIPLGWEKLYNIAQGVAYGLEYLHRGCNTRIVHLDIKPHNILLDGEFCPKISDFGLAKLCLEKNSKISMVGTRGTIGYIAPEVFSRNFGVVSSKSDVYSYGMMLLEMVGGRKNIDAKAENTSQIYYPHWIYEHLNHEGDLEAWEVTEETEEIARKMILVGLWCIQTLPGDRPSMSKVVDMLEGCSKDLQMPPKPYLSSPVRSTHDCSTVSIS